MKLLRFALALGVLALAACSDSPITPESNITGEPCASGSSNCRLVTAHQIAVDSWALYSQPVPYDTPAVSCSVTSATIDRAELGTYWRCDWKRVT